MGVCTKERKGVTAEVLMATPCTNSQEVKARGTCLEHFSLLLPAMAMAICNGEKSPSTYPSLTPPTVCGRRAHGAMLNHGGGFGVVISGRVDKSRL